MNIAQLLDYGPRLSAAPPPKEPEKRGKRYSPKKIRKYRELSVDGQIWSALIAAKLGRETSGVAKDLKQLCDDGYLVSIGKYTESKASNKPVLYCWVDNAELCGVRSTSERAPG